MKGKIFCDEKKLFVTYDKEKKDELVKNLKYAFGNMIGLPNNGTILKLEEKLKGIIPNRKSIQKELKERALDNWGKIFSESQAAAISSASTKKNKKHEAK